MSENIHLVFSIPPSRVTPEDYNAWYDQHLFEILVVPGFEAARRYSLQPSNGQMSPTEFPYLSMYEIEGDVPTIMAELQKEGTSGNMRLPEWFSEITFASWNCVALGDTHGPHVLMPDHAYLVFSRQPTNLSFEEYSAWYSEHLEENVNNSTCLLRGWRFQLEPAGPDRDAYRGGPSHLALYELAGDVQAMGAELGEKIARKEIILPAWFDHVSFAGLDAAALGERVTTKASRP